MPLSVTSVWLIAGTATAQN